MLSIFKKDLNPSEKIISKAKELMIDVVTYKMSGNIDVSAYNKLKILLAELEKNHCLEKTKFDKNICFEPQKEIKILDLLEIIKGENPRNIIIPVELYSSFIVSYCREAISTALTDYALRFNRDEANSVTELRNLIYEKALEFATKNLDENLDKINLMHHSEEEIKIIKPTDDEVSRLIIKSVVDNFDMFYIRKSYLEQVGLIDKNEKNIRNTIFKIKFYNNSLYILRVLLNLNIKNFGDNAIDIGIADCCRISGVKLRGDLDNVVKSLEKFVNRNENLTFTYVDSIANNISKFHDDTINNQLNYDILLETVDLLIKNIDLNLIREVTACIAILLLTKYKKGKLGALEKICILDEIIDKTF